METKDFRNLSVGTVVEYGNFSGPMIVCKTENGVVSCNSIDDDGMYYVFDYDDSDAEYFEVIPKDSLVYGMLMEYLDAKDLHVEDGKIRDKNGSVPKRGFYSRMVGIMGSRNPLHRVFVFLFFFALNYLFFGLIVLAFNKLNFCGWWLSTLAITIAGYAFSLIAYPAWRNYLLPRVIKMASK